MSDQLLPASKPYELLVPRLNVKDRNSLSMLLNSLATIIQGNPMILILMKH